MVPVPYVGRLARYIPCFPFPLIIARKSRESRIYMVRYQTVIKIFIYDIRLLTIYVWYISCICYVYPKYIVVHLDILKFFQPRFTVLP